MDDEHKDREINVHLVDDEQYIAAESPEQALEFWHGTDWKEIAESTDAPISNDDEYYTGDDETKDYYSTMSERADEMIEEGKQAPFSVGVSFNAM